LNEDFIAAAVPMMRGDLFTSASPRFDIAIINPSYRKIRSDSFTRLLLRSAGIEASNLYAGFVAFITRLLDTGGELVGSELGLTSKYVPAIQLHEDREFPFWEDSVMTLDFRVEYQRSQLDRFSFAGFVRCLRAVDLLQLQIFNASVIVFVTAVLGACSGLSYMRSSERFNRALATGILILILAFFYALLLLPTKQGCQLQ